MDLHLHQPSHDPEKIVSISISNPDLPPMAYQRLIGRAAEQAQLLDVLREPKGQNIIAIVGLGGIGKTALARDIAMLSKDEGYFSHVVWAGIKPDHFIDGRILPGDGGTYDSDMLLCDIGRQCGRPDIPFLPPMHRLEAVRQLLLSYRVLVVLDNFETVSDPDNLVRHTSEMLGQSKLLITSRHRIGQDQAHTINLRGLSATDGVDFLQEELSIGHVAGGQAVSTRILRVIHSITGGAPLAMKLVIGQMRQAPVEVVLKHLQQASAAGAVYQFYHFVYARSWALLDDDGRVALVDMSVFPPLFGGTIADVERISQLDASRFRPSMRRLVALSLVDEVETIGTPRYALHPLTHYFVLSDITRELPNEW